MNIPVNFPWPRLLHQKSLQRAARLEANFFKPGPGRLPCRDKSSATQVKVFAFAVCIEVPNKKPFQSPKLLPPTSSFCTHSLPESRPPTPFQSQNVVLPSPTRHRGAHRVPSLHHLVAAIIGPHYHRWQPWRLPRAHHDLDRS